MRDVVIVDAFGEHPVEVEHRMKHIAHHVSEHRNRPPRDMPAARLKVCKESYDPELTKKLKGYLK